ncbi:MAG: glycerophosphoryl diester phosphodiesterase membrane domain-containing protein [Lacisediminihabitans sp.]
MSGSPSAPGAPQHPSGWTPPPKPGLIPLRPLDLGTILGAAFKTMRYNPKPTFGTALLVQGIVYVVAMLVVGLVAFASFSRIGSANSQDLTQITVGSYGAIALSAIVPVLLSIAASALLQGVIVLAVMRATLGEKPKLRQLFTMAKGRIWALIGWTGLVALVVIVAVAVIVGLIVLLVLTGNIAGVIGSVLVGIFGGLGLAACWVWLSTKLSLVPSVLMAERTSIRDAMRRSWALTNRSFWKTFGIQLLVAMIVGIAAQVITTPISFIAGMLIGLADPNGQNPGTAIGAGIAVYVVLVIVTVVFAAITAVIQSATVALIYVDLRMRKEGLDLDLARFVEARQSGSSGLADPFSTVSTSVSAAPQYGSPTPPAPTPAPPTAAPPTPPAPAAPMPPAGDSPWT